MTGDTWARLLMPDDLLALQAARVGRLATVGVRGFPTVVPICFALLDVGSPMIVSVLDQKRKSVKDAELGRVRNIRRYPQVGLTIDHYEEDWAQLFYIQIRGLASIVEPGDPLHAHALAELRIKYTQYQAMSLEDRGVIVIVELRVRVWHANS